MNISRARMETAQMTTATEDRTSPSRDYQCFECAGQCQEKHPAGRHLTVRQSPTNYHQKTAKCSGTISRSTCALYNFFFIFMNFEKSLRANKCLKSLS